MLHFQKEQIRQVLHARVWHVATTVLLRCTTCARGKYKLELCRLYTDVIIVIPRSGAEVSLNMHLGEYCGFLLLFSPSIFVPPRQRRQTELVIRNQTMVPH